MPVVSTVHFSLNDHSLKDFSFLIYNKDINCTDKRRSITIGRIGFNSFIFNFKSKIIDQRHFKKLNLFSNLCFST